MIDLDPRWMIAIGFVLLLIGVILPFLMVIQVLVSTFFLNFFAYGASFLGVIVGVTGALMYLMQNRGRNR